MHICPVDDIEEPGCKGISVAGEALFIIRQNGRFYVYRNRCPHLGIELNWLPDQFLNNDRNLIQCSTHGALFQITTGECLAGPCQGSWLEPVPFDVNPQGELILAGSPGP